MQQSDKSQSELLDEELVAYLDGELDSQAARQVEQRLAADEPVRRRLQELAQSWDLLDNLPPSAADDTFTRSTVEMVAVAVEQELANQQSAEPRHRRRRWLWGGVLALVAGAAGFVAAANLWVDPNEKLLGDLPVIENLEVYEHVGDIAFLKRLNDEGLFTDEPADAAAPRDEARGAKETPELPVVPNSLAERRQRLEGMSAQTKEELLAKFEKFESLSPDDQERFRRLDVQVDSDPQADRLRRIMARFHEWLKTLLTTERADLLASNPDDRIHGIRQLRHEQEARLAGQAGGPLLLPRDVDELHKWMELFSADHKTQLMSIKEIPEQRKKQLESPNPAIRRIGLAGFAWRQWQIGNVGNGKPVDVSDKEIQQLKDRLSKPFSDELNSKKTKQQQIQTVSGWIKALPRFFARQGGEGGPVIDPEELSKFFESLPAPQRDELMKLPRDDMNRRLRFLYFQHKRAERGLSSRESAGPRDSPGSTDSGRGAAKPDKPPKTGATPDKETSTPTDPAGAAAADKRPNKGDDPAPADNSK
ncbi:MAG TPA: hypothetical protein VGY55_05420 [Pirellulales bacterium]|jgi:hypothetical protein|nr:hypothetical protein [Pirellulales bacterium]